MTNEGTAISVESMSKSFKLPHQKRRSLKSVFTNIFSLGNTSYEIQRALKDISFEVKEGEFLGIVGRNGSGKSTLLKILAGIYQPTKGRVKINGRLVPFIELGVGFNGELSGRENVYLNGALLGFSEKEVTEKYDDIVSFAELEKFMDQKLKNYSSGMQVRLAFSVATILASTDILLIDEVLAVGDASFQRKCFEYFTELKSNNKTVVFVSHDMEAIKEYCDRAILIHEGLIKVEGKPEVVAKEYFKLFNKQSESKKATKNRWGKGFATIKNAEVSVGEKSITISAEITSTKDIIKPIIGFNIRQANSEYRIMGTNTKIEQVDTGTLKSGSTMQVDFSVPNILSESQYKVDIAVLDRNSIDTYDWWENAIVFNIQRDRKLPFPLQLEIKTTAKVKK